MIDNLNPLLISGEKTQLSYINLYEETKRINKEIDWVHIQEVIHSLKELRKNTWDKERVDRIINLLKNRFEVENDK